MALAACPISHLVQPKSSPKAAFCERDWVRCTAYGSTPKPYEPPTKVPDSGLTAGEVVLLVLDALKHNNVPTVNRGVEILFGYSSSGSQIKNEEGLTPAEYADFLKETEYKVLFEHGSVTIDKGDYSFDGKKGFFTARLQTGPQPLDFTSCNFILTSEGAGDDAAWMVDSILIRPESMNIGNGAQSFTVTPGDCTTTSACEECGRDSTFPFTASLDC